MRHTRRASNACCASGVAPNVPSVVRLWQGFVFMFGCMFWEVSRDVAGKAALIKYQGRQHAFVLREFDSDDAQHALQAMRDFIPGLGATPA